MSKRSERAVTTSGRSKRLRLSPEETLKRMQTFARRKEEFIAAVRKGKNRSVSS